MILHELAWFIVVHAPRERFGHMVGKRVLLIVGGGVAAFKALETARLLMTQGFRVETVMTRAACEFIQPLSFASLTGARAHTEMFELNAEVEMGHIELSRSADIVLVAPATADLMAKMAHGLATDLASTLLLATDKAVIIAPAMNVRMWEHPATQRNRATLQSDGIRIVGPVEGAMACGEFGAGRLSEPSDIAEAVISALTPNSLAGQRIIVTSGPTREAIDPVRYLSNHSSGRQGVAIAQALARRGADVVFVTGPATFRKPLYCDIQNVESAKEMYDAVMAALPASAAIFAAAVADWRPAHAASEKMKKVKGAAAMTFVENPDILADIAQLPSEKRPALVVGFAAETENLEAHATEKRAKKQCDWLVANDVSMASGVMGGDHNMVMLLSEEGLERWPRMDKTAVAELLADRIAQALGNNAARLSS
jgi:phosphopantothenoylcysteine decarboxylase/phosphopantothenate--cysteine ligase